MERAFHFSRAELTLNRAGRLSPAQRARLQAPRGSRVFGRKYVLVTASIVAGVHALCLALVGSGRSAELVLLVSLPFLLTYGSLGAFVAWAAYRARDLARGRVHEASGRIHKRVEVVRSSDGAVVGERYWIRAGRLKYVTLDPDEFAVLHAGRPYRFFYLSYAPAHLILSVEPVEHARRGGPRKPGGPRNPGNPEDLSATPP